MSNQNQPMVKLSASAAIIADITDGERPSVSTIHRWASRGLAGITLRTAYAGGHRRTTEPWIRDFFARVTAAKDGRPAPGDSGDDIPSARSRMAEQELTAAGL